jgi:hypothetical protein
MRISTMDNETTKPESQYMGEPDTARTETWLGNGVSIIKSGKYYYLKIEETVLKSVLGRMP